MKPWVIEVRGIREGPNESRNAPVSNGAPGDAVTGLSDCVTRFRTAGQSTGGIVLLTRSIDR